MKKIIFLLIFGLMLTSGCSVKYELNISSDYKFLETIQVFGNNTDISDDADAEFMNPYIESYLANNSIYKFTKKNISDSSYDVTILGEMTETEFYGSNLHYIYNNSNFETDEFGNKIFAFSRIEYSDDVAYSPLEFENVEIIINSEKRIINSNADSISDNKCIWYMSNSQVKDIYFELVDDDTKTEEQIRSEIKEKTESSEIAQDFSSFIYVVIGLVILLIIGGIFLFFKHKKNNKI